MRPWFPDSVYHPCLIALKNVTLGDIHADGHVNIVLEFCAYNTHFIACYVCAGNVYWFGCVCCADRRMDFVEFKQDLVTFLLFFVCLPFF